MNDDCPPHHAPCRAEANTFRELVRDHEAMVHATAKRFTRDAALAEDVTQETFLALARQPHAALGSVEAWLRRVAGRKAINAVRGEARRRRHEEAATSMPTSTSEPRWMDARQAIRHILEEMPPHLKEPLVEHYLEGRTQQDVASRKGISQSTVSRKLDAGIRELKRRLRARGILCGAGLTTLCAAPSATASPTTLASMLGKLTTSGAGSSTSPATIASAILTMKITKVTLAAAAACALIGIPALVIHRQDAPVKPTATKPIAPPSPATGFARPSSLPQGPAGTPRRYHPDPVPERMRLKVDALVRRYKNMTKEEQLLDEEYQKMMNAFVELANLPSVQARIEKALMELLEVKGPGDSDAAANGELPFNISVEPGRFDEPLGRSWLEAVVSAEPKRVQDWVVNRLEGATFDFAYDPTLERSGEGVTITDRPKAPADAEDGSED